MWRIDVLTLLSVWKTRLFVATLEEGRFRAAESLSNWAEFAERTSKVMSPFQSMDD